MTECCGKQDGCCSSATPDVRIEVVSQARYLAGARDLVRAVAGRLGFDAAQCGRIALAVDEALCNVINHGYDKRPDGRIWISIWPMGDPMPERPTGIRIVIEDNAKQVDPEKIKPRDLAEIRPGGLGVHIIREVMDCATYEKRNGAGMRLTMEKKLDTCPPKDTQ
ncbi:MAG: ATP-binding protein [Phycisphaerales bacterium]|nr:ATP-binding protein [Phycisphaerales bacterium]